MPRKIHVNITITPELLAELDKDAQRMYFNRSQYIEYCVSRMIEARRFMAANPKIQQQMTELQQSLSDIALQGDKDFAGVFGQTSILDLDQSKKTSKGKK